MDAERDAQSIKERTDADVQELQTTRGDVLAALREIQARIEGAVRRERIAAVKTPAMSEEA
ncbi:MAG TPA: hypothetical protein VGC05_11195 [Mycobacterium sp.]